MGCGCALFQVDALLGALRGRLGAPSALRGRQGAPSAGRPLGIPGNALLLNPCPPNRAAATFQRAATASTHSVMPCGTVASEHYDGTIALTHKVISQLKAKRGRSPDGEKAHQHTPAFVHAAVRHAVHHVRTAEDDDEGDAGTALYDMGDAEIDKVMPRGGTSDVGHHSGSEAVRDTAWPLVREVWQVSSRKRTWTSGALGFRTLYDVAA